MIRLKKYGPVPIEMILCSGAVINVLAMFDFSRPTLYHSKELDSVAHKAAEENRINHAIDSDLEPTEWYIEYMGKKIGSNPA